METPKKREKTLEERVEKLEYDFNKLIILLEKMSELNDGFIKLLN